jgi:hypothetical protein
MASEGRSVGGCGTRTIAKPELVHETIWLCPIEDRRALDSSREGMVEGFSLGSYLMLVDQTVISSQPLQLVRSLDPASSTHSIPPARPAAFPPGPGVVKLIMGEHSQTFSERTLSPVWTE